MAKTKKAKEVVCKCVKCGKKAYFFHSKCCNAHFEGIIYGKKFGIVCEKCGQFVAELKIKQLLKDDKNI